MHGGPVGAGLGLGARRRHRADSGDQAVEISGGEYGGGQGAIDAARDERSGSAVPGRGGGGDEVPGGDDGDGESVETERVRLSAAIIHLLAALAGDRFELMRPQTGSSSHFDDHSA